MFKKETQQAALISLSKRRKVVAMLLGVLLAIVLASVATPARGVVHPVTPSECFGNANAGGVQAFGSLLGTGQISGFPVPANTPGVGIDVGDGATDVTPSC